jgi:hypothetical protein
MSSRARSQNKTLLPPVQKARTGFLSAEPGKSEKRVNMMLESEMEKWRRRVQGGSSGLVNAERVSRVPSCIEGAVRGLGGGLAEEKPLMVQRVMWPSLSALEKIKSP